MLCSVAAARSLLSRAEGFQPEIRGGDLPGTGEVVSGSRTCGLKPLYTSRLSSSLSVLFLARSSAAGEHRFVQFGKRRLLRGGVLLPCGGVPSLHTVDRPHHDAVLVEARIRTQMRRDRDAALLVWFLVRSPRGEHPLVVPDPLLASGGAPRGFSDLINELVCRPDGQAVLLESRDHQAVSKLVAIPRRKDQTAFVVELGSVGAKKHPPSLNPTHRPPYSTLPHNTPLF